MKQYNIWVVYDKENEESFSEEITVTATTFENAVKRLNDYEDPVSSHLPKIYEIHKGPTLDVNRGILTEEDKIFLNQLAYAY